MKFKASIDDGSSWMALNNFYELQGFLTEIFNRDWEVKVRRTA